MEQLNPTAVNVSTTRCGSHSLALSVEAAVNQLEPGKVLIDKVKTSIKKVRRKKDNLNQLEAQGLPEPVISSSTVTTLTMIERMLEIRNQMDSVPAVAAKLKFSGKHILHMYNSSTILVEIHLLYN